MLSIEEFNQVLEDKYIYSIEEPYRNGRYVWIFVMMMSIGRL